MSWFKKPTIQEMVDDVIIEDNRRYNRNLKAATITGESINKVLLVTTKLPKKLNLNCSGCSEKVTDR